MAVAIYSWCLGWKTEFQSRMSKDKKTLPEKFKDFFGFSKQTAATQVTYEKPKPEDYIVTCENIKDISSECPIGHRLKYIKELCEIVRSKRLKQNAVEAVVAKTEDLLNPSVSVEARQLVLHFYSCLVQGQHEKMTTMRGYFFKKIKNHQKKEDITQRLELFRALTESGKVIVYFEEETGPFLLEWMPDVISAGKSTEFLPMLVNVIKFNAAYLDQDIISGLVQHSCTLCCRTNSEEVVQLCLDVLDAVICYSYLPSNTLPHFVTTLCCIVNVEKFSQTSWKLMRNLLGTHLGHGTICTMCKILQDRQNQMNHGLLRGAVFFIGMSLWGTKKVPSLKHTPTAVLPSFLKALDCEHNVVAYEVVLAIHRLVQKYNSDLHVVSWNLILNIIEKLAALPEVSRPSFPPSNCVTTLHNLISTVEQLHESGSFNGSVERLFDIVEKCSMSRPEPSVLRLVQYRAQEIYPTKEQWIPSLNLLMEKFFKHETRTAVRVRVLHVLSYLLRTQRYIYEEELVDQAILQHLGHLETDHDITTKNVAVQLLVDFAQDSCSKRCLDVLEILEKVISKPFEQSLSGKECADTVHIVNEDEVIDIKTAVSGLVEVFKKKLHCLPSSHAVYAYQLLINHLKVHYSGPVAVEQTSRIRKVIFEFLLKLRCNALGQVGIANSENQIYYSPYLLRNHTDSGTEHVTHGNLSPPPHSLSPAAHPTSIISYMPLDLALKAVVTCLKQETDWGVLKLVLQQLPHFLQNKAIVLCGKGSIRSLCLSLCIMVSDRNSGLPEKLRNAPLQFIRSDFHAFIFPVLAALAAYHGELDQHAQRMLINCLEFGLVSKCARMCIVALTLCTLEMRDVMYKLLPNIIISLSKISANVRIAVPILEFLSCLIRLPSLYVSFVEDQYISIFAIALPYTNPFKFSLYTVSLAHRVIAMWFLKCRLPFRRDFVPYIFKGLRANVLVPLEEKNTASAQILNEDSSLRKRSSSMVEQGVRRRREPRLHVTSLTASPSCSDSAPSLDTSLRLNTELVETCQDMLVRYTYGMCSTLPRRSPVSQFLLENGQQSSWLLGTMLITVTTSGCGTKTFKNGMCDRCYRLCKTDADDIPESGNVPMQKSRSSGEILSSRRRHRSAIQRSASSEVSHYSLPQSKDDIQIRHQSCEEISSRRTKQNTETKDSAHLFSPCIQQDTVTEEQNLDRLVSTLSDGQKSSETGSSHLCSCWCQGWAEVHIRRPSGNISWMMRIQNAMFFPSSPPDFPLPDITALFSPSRQEDRDRSEVTSHKRIDSESLEEKEYEAIHKQHFCPQDSSVVGSSSGSNCQELEQQKNRSDDQSLANPFVSSSNKPSKIALRRTNSSPEMRGKWPDTSSPISGVDSLGKLVGIAPSVSQSPKPVVYDDRSVLTSLPFQSTDLSVKDTALEKDVSQKSVSQDSSSQKVLVTSHFHQEIDVPKQIEESTPKQSDSEGKLERESGRSSTRKSPRKEERYESIPEEPKTGSDQELPEKLLKHGMKQKLRLDLSSVNQSSDANRPTESPVPPHSASPFFKTRSPPRSPPLKGNVSPPAYHRERVHTISVMSPIQSKRSSSEMLRKISSPYRDMYRSGLSPSFVFLQMYNTMAFGAGNDRPLLLPKSEVINRAVKVLDRIPPYETHKIGVVYVGVGQSNNEAAILGNQFGSLRYNKFLQNLGTLLRLKDVDPLTNYIGGLDVDGEDGKYAFSWQDDVMQVIFHVATLLPNKPSDPLCNSKKRHIGNNHVTIVFNESGEDYSMTTIKGQFVYACVIIQPGDFNSNIITVKTKQELQEIIGHCDPHIVSDHSLSIYVRQLALHANLACSIFKSTTSSSEPYISNWLERLRQLKRLRTKILQEIPTDDAGMDSASSSSSYYSHHKHPEDFTDYT
ncbi:TSC complex subunit tuberin isoform X3 [Tachypleus tridentatus]|uniref:TSC complex subunit tuberin isoform X3 n=1 Tax=Tachypleus tridentatus TaxID=6853 RepID=UPI003FD39D9A